MDTAGSAPAFHQYFKQRVNDVQDQIDSLSRPDIPAESRKGVSENILANLAKLSAALADASGNLASYDQRSHSQTIKTLQDQLSVSQAATARKTKFSFKNKKLSSGVNSTPLPQPSQRSHLLPILSASASDVDSTTTSRSATPLHLQDPENGTLQGRKPVPPIAPPSSHVSTFEHNQNTSLHTITVLRASADKSHEEAGITVSSKTNTYISLEHLNLQTGYKDEISAEGHLAPQMCMVSQTTHSVINLAPKSMSNVAELSSLTLTGLDNILLLATSVTGPVHITDVQHSTLVLSCRQFRMHDSHDVDIYLHCTSRPIIENCTGIRFAAMPENFPQTNSSGATNMFDQVDDFKWLRAEASPNWQILPEDKQVGRNTWTDVQQEIKKLDCDPEIESSALASTVASILGVLIVKSAK